MQVALFFSPFLGRLACLPRNSCELVSCIPAACDSVNPLPIILILLQGFGLVLLAHLVSQGSASSQTKMLVFLLQTVCK